MCMCVYLYVIMYMTLVFCINSRKWYSEQIAVFLVIIFLEEEIVGPWNPQTLNYIFLSIGLPLNFLSLLMEEYLRVHAFQAVFPGFSISDMLPPQVCHMNNIFLCFKKDWI